jgi:hypothetical protein
MMPSKKEIAALVWGLRRAAGGPWCGECGECFAGLPKHKLWKHLRKKHGIGPYKMLQRRVRDLEALINTPETQGFLIAVDREAAHQVLRWGEDDRAKKSDVDWIWLMTYLAAKAVFGKTQFAREVANSARARALEGLPDAKGGPDGQEKYLHRIITVAAAAMNWHRNRWPGRSLEA